MESFPELEIKDFSGQEYEELFVTTMNVGWDADAFLNARKREDLEKVPFGTYTDPIIKDWFDEQADPDLPSFDKWKKLSSLGKKQTLLDWLMTKQPEGRPDLGTTLRNLVAEELNLEPGEVEKLKLYSSTHSPIDTLYGVDGFFRYQNQTATFDLTTNPEKFDSGVKYGKADEVISCAPWDEGCLRKAARGLAHEIRAKIERVEADQRQGARDPRLASQEERDRAIANRIKELRKRRRLLN